MAKVGVVADSFLENGAVYQGGAQLHLLQLARLAVAHGAEVTVYQAAAADSRQHYEGLAIVNVEATTGEIWQRGTERALADGSSHIHYQNLHCPLRRDAAWVTATCHAVYWDHPYDPEARAWYPHGSIDRFALPLWRYAERKRAILYLGRCAEVLATDTSLLRIVQSEAPYLRTRVHVAVNFSDIETADRQTGDRRDHPELSPLIEARAQGQLVVLVPRNLSLDRGGAWLPRIVEETSQRLGGACHFFVTGQPVDVYGRGKRYLEAFQQGLAAIRSEARRRVSLLSGLPRSAMAGAYLASEVVLIPTYSHEGSSLAAIEAMMCGRPVVATNVGGLNDIVADGWTGLLVRPEVGAIADGIEQLGKDRVLREEMGEAAAVVARARFTLERWQERVLPFIERNGWLR
jgi:glycosyltransferase involved in cell wall biosynthesis